jgi:hypothetical protein
VRRGFTSEDVVTAEGIREECKPSTCEMLLNGPPGYQRYVVAQLVEAMQAGRSLVRFPMVSLKFFIDIFLPAALWP